MKVNHAEVGELKYIDAAKGHMESGNDADAPFAQAFAQISIAISLQRIADAAERIAQAVYEDTDGRGYFRTHTENHY
jgi:hypothetical protein